ncbi:MAG: hypothetical protein ACUVX9_15680 [Anaerolineae bacterium]
MANSPTSLHHSIQALMTFMVVNAKREVKLLVGVTFRPQAEGSRTKRR